MSNNNVTLLYDYFNTYTDEKMIDFQLRQLIKHYGQEKVNDAMLGYYKFVPELEQLGLHINNLHNTFGKVNVLKLFFSEYKKVG